MRGVGPLWLPRLRVLMGGESCDRLRSENIFLHSARVIEEGK